MSDACSWLPALIYFADHGGDWHAYVDVLHGHFRADFVNHRPSLARRPCRIIHQPLDCGKEPTFWHITSVGAVEAERTPDLRRCERIRWPRPIIEIFPNDCVKAWRVRRGQKWRINLAPSDFSYLVVLQDYPNRVLLITAFYVEQTHRRQKLGAEWKANKV